MKDRVTNSDLQQVLAYLRRDADNIGRIDERLETLRTDVKKLERIVLDGDGNTTSILVEVVTLKLELRSLAEANKTWSTGIKEEATRKKQDNTAIIVATISGIVSIIAALLVFAKG